VEALRMAAFRQVNALLRGRARFSAITRPLPKIRERLLSGSFCVGSCTVIDQSRHKAGFGRRSKKDLHRICRHGRYDGGGGAADLRVVQLAVAKTTAHEPVNTNERR